MAHATIVKRLAGRRPAPILELHVHLSWRIGKCVKLCQAQRVRHRMNIVLCECVDVISVLVLGFVTHECDAFSVYWKMHY